MKVISIVNRKGGTGKTSVTANLAFELGREGKNILLIDLDPQTDLTKLFFARKLKGRQNVFEVLLSKCKIQDTIVEVRNNISLIPGSKNMAYFDKKYSESVLKKALGTKEMQKKYDMVIIDHPPQITEATLAGLIATDEIILVTDCERFSIDNLEDQISELKAIKQKMNPSLKILGIIVNRVDMRRKLTKSNLHDLSIRYKNYLFKTTISNDCAIPTSIYNNQLIRELHWRSKTVSQFKNLKQEVLRRMS